MMLLLCKHIKYKTNNIVRTHFLKFVSMNLLLRLKRLEQQVNTIIRPQSKED